LIMAQIERWRQA